MIAVVFIDALYLLFASYPFYFYNWINIKKEIKTQRGVRYQEGMDDVELRTESFLIADILIERFSEEITQLRLRLIAEMITNP